MLFDRRSAWWTIGGLIVGLVAALFLGLAAGCGYTSLSYAERVLSDVFCQGVSDVFTHSRMEAVSYVIFFSIVPVLGFFSMFVKRLPLGGVEALMLPVVTYALYGFLMGQFFRAIRWLEARFSHLLEERRKSRR